MRDAGHRTPDAGHRTSDNGHRTAKKAKTRLVSNVGYRDHTTPLFKNLKVLKFEDIVKHKVCMLLFKAKRGLLPRNIQCLFTLNTKT